MHVENHHIHLAALVSLLFVVGMFATPNVAQAADSPVGVWKTIDDETGEAKSLVKIYERNGKLYGKITELLQKPGALCEKCTGDDKDKPIEGMLIMWSLVPDGDEWTDGRIFDQAKGKTYNCKIWLEDGNLKVRWAVLPHPDLVPQVLSLVGVHARLLECARHGRPTTGRSAGHSTRADPH